MFKRIHRFTFRSSVPKYTLATPYFTVRYQKIEGNFQVAIVVGKKVSRKAVIRNNLKRRLSEIIKQYLSQSSPFCLVFYLKKSIEPASNQEISDSLKQALKKIGIIIEAQSAKRKA